MSKIVTMLAACCAAYRINNNRIYKWTDPEHTSNLSLAKSCLAGEITVTPADTALAEEIIDFYSKHMMAAVLSNHEVTSYSFALHAILDNKAKRIKLRYLVWAPHSYANMLKHAELNQQLTFYHTRSIHMGVPGDAVTVDFTQLHVSVGTDYGFQIVTGHTGSNDLVSFVVRNNDRHRLAKLGTNIRFSARIKKHVYVHVRRSVLGKSTKITQLNYIKVING